MRFEMYQPNKFYKMIEFEVFSCGHATLLEALSIRRSIYWSVGPSVVIELKMRILMLPLCLSMCVCLGWVRVWMGVVCPCPPNRNNIVTQLRFLYFFVNAPCYLMGSLNFANFPCYSMGIEKLGGGQKDIRTDR